MEGGKITIKLDLGAKASVFPPKVHNRPFINHTSDTTTTLLAYGESIIKSVGTCTLACKGKITSHVKLYIVSIDVQPILGLTDRIRLGLIQRVYKFLTCQRYRQS